MKQAHDLQSRDTLCKREVRPFDIVSSRKGHDAGRLFIVLRADNGWVFLSDGKTRKLDNPKKKSVKHIGFEKASGWTPPLSASSARADKLIRAELGKYRGEVRGERGTKIVKG